MHLDALKHMVRVIRTLGHQGSLVVFGSSSLLAVFPEEGESDGVLAASYDADFVPEPWDDDIAQMLHEAIGRDRRFEKIHGYHADFVRPMAFENFPPDWRMRTIPLAEGEDVWCLEPHDMAAAKCIAGRPKDVEQLAGLAAKGKLDLDLVYKRISSMPLIEKMIVKANATLTQVRALSPELAKQRQTPAPIS